MEEEKSPKPGGEPKCIKGAAAGAGGQGRGGRAGGGSRREVWGAEWRGGPTGGERSAAAPTPARTRARTHTLTSSQAPRTPGPAAPSGVRRMKSEQRRGHRARARRPGTGQAGGRGGDGGKLCAWRPGPARPPLHLTAAGALGLRAEARRPLCRAPGRPLPPPQPYSRRPARGGYCSAQRPRCLALLVLRAWHWLRLA